MIAVGVSGGIAAYKACELVRWLQQRGATVIVVMTRGAAEFVTPLTFQTLSGNPVVLDLWGDQAPSFRLPPAAMKKLRGRVEHVDVAEVVDALVIAPATANLMARIVHGEAPDALTSLVLACRAPLLVCPAMDVEMWRQPATQANVRVLKSRGAAIVGPETGYLASGLAGPGRLAAVEAIGEAVVRALVTRESMKGVRVLVGSGRTEEPVDPVRMLTNRSSGRQGVALAEAARDRGAEVVFVTGPASVDPPLGVKVEHVRTALEMDRVMTRASGDADIVLMSAAVADYRPELPSVRKLKRTSDETTIRLVANPDILASLGAERRPGQTLVGFALETHDGIRHARAKLEAKHIDLIVLNAPADGIGRETNKATLVERGRREALPEMPKREVAERILDRVLEMRAEAKARKAAKPAKAAKSSPKQPARKAAKARTKR